MLTSPKYDDKKQTNKYTNKTFFSVKTIYLSYPPQQKFERSTKQHYHCYRWIYTSRRVTQTETYLQKNAFGSWSNFPIHPMLTVPSNKLAVYLWFPALPSWLCLRGKTRWLAEWCQLHQNRFNIKMVHILVVHSGRVINRRVSTDQPDRPGIL